MLSALSRDTNARASVVSANSLSGTTGAFAPPARMGMLGVAAAIANAIEDAVGVRVTQIPFTPERVLAAIEAAR